MNRDAHPWYGPCDGFGPNGACSECKRVEMLGDNLPDRKWLEWLWSDR